MIITRTPYRISFFGGGTDYPKWFNENGGEVLSTSINKYCYISARNIQNFFDYKYRVVWSIIENCNDISEITHPCVREMFKYLKYNFDGIEIKHSGDLPARSGIGSSSSFTVGLLNALTSLYNYKLSKKKLAIKSIHIEQKILKESVGSQDQIAASYGGFNNIIFSRYNNFSIKKNSISSKRLKQLNENLMLFFTGLSRDSDKNAKKIISSITSKAETFKQLKLNVKEALEILKSNSNIDQFGKLLHESWLQKKSLADSISNEKINEIYSEAISKGSLGGKILGSGNGGFILLFVPKRYQSKIIKNFYKLLHVPFQFENTGSTVIFKNNLKNK